MSEDSDVRRVPAAEGRSELREKGSRFFGFATRVDSPEAAGKILEALRRTHHDATHVAFAWRIGAGPAAASRFSDAGEPAGTAGRPIAGAVAASGLTDVLVAVVRYFGGTRLGTGGLARAYRAAAARAVEAAGAETIYDTVGIEVRCAYEQLGLLRRLLAPPTVRLRSERFTPEPVFELEVRRSRLAEIEAALKEARLGYEIVDL